MCVCVCVLSLHPLEVFLISFLQSTRRCWKQQQTCWSTSNRALFIPSAMKYLLSFPLPNLDLYPIMAAFRRLFPHMPLIVLFVSITIYQTQSLLSLRRRYHLFRLHLSLLSFRGNNNNAIGFWLYYCFIVLFESCEIYMREVGLDISESC